LRIVSLETRSTLRLLPDKDKQLLLDKYGELPEEQDKG
jgi:hypothetical protein